MATAKLRKETAKLKEAIKEAQAARPASLPRPTINNTSRVRPAQEVAINTAIRKERAIEPIVRKQNVPGNNVNF